jgi:hypothetical protein
MSDPLVEPAVSGVPASAVAPRPCRCRTPVAGVVVVAVEAESATSVAVFVPVRLITVPSILLVLGSGRRPVPGVSVASGLPLFVVVSPPLGGVCVAVGLFLPFCAGRVVRVRVSIPTFTKKMYASKN